MKYREKHYMIPTDWSTEAEDEEEALLHYGLPVEGELGALSKMKKAYAGIALFDMCRTTLSDQQGTKGRHTPAVGGPDSFPNVGVCFATASGQPAADGMSGSPFADALVEVCPSVAHS